MKKDLRPLKHDGLSRLLEQGIQRVQPSRVVLFGSRARGDHRENSDFDIAFFFNKEKDSAWSKFLYDISESPLVLFKVDWVAAATAQAELIQKINDEGIVLYEK